MPSCGRCTNACISALTGRPGHGQSWGQPCFRLEASTARRVTGGPGQTPAEVQADSASGIDRLAWQLGAGTAVRESAGPSNLFVNTESQGQILRGLVRERVGAGALQFKGRDARILGVVPRRPRSGTNMRGVSPRSSSSSYTAREGRRASGLRPSTLTHCRTASKKYCRACAWVRPENQVPNQRQQDAYAQPEVNPQRRIRSASTGGSLSGTCVTLPEGDNDS